MECLDCKKFQYKLKDFKDFILHECHCPEKKINCKYDCEFSCERKNMIAHEESCSLRKIVCQKCGFACMFVEKQLGVVKHNFETCTREPKKEQDFFNGIYQNSQNDSDRGSIDETQK